MTRYLSFNATVHLGGPKSVAMSSDPDGLKEMAGILTTIADGNTQYRIDGPDGHQYTVDDITEVALGVSRS